MNMDVINMDHSITITEFYRNKNVFITGATGFLGKVLIEKLLRSCPDIGTIYVLIRPKKGKNIHERVQDILQEMLFDTIKSTDASQINKIVPVLGDCAQLNLGLSESDYSLIKSSVNVIFHVAASVRFDDALSFAILLNTRGTREACTLALQTENLYSFVHVSTTYSNCVVGAVVEEELYPPPDDWRKAIEIAEKFDKNLLPVFGDKYLGPYPNTYTFTKALAESVIKDLCLGKIPAVICRPSIVISSLKEPVKGWIDNFNGPLGVLIASGKGLLRTSYQDTKVFPDYIPVDCVVKSIIVASWDTALKKDLTKLEVLNCCSGKRWMSLDKMVTAFRELSQYYPLNNSIWVPKGSATKCKYYSYICVVFFHLIPAFFFDVALKVLGKKPILTKLQAKIYSATIQLRYFTTQEWKFKNEKFCEQEKRILGKEKDVWSYDFSNEDMLRYTLNAIIGCRKYLLKESDETLPAAKRHYQRMYWLDKAAMTILYGSWIWLFFSFGVRKVIWNKIITYFNYYIDGNDF